MMRLFEESTAQAEHRTRNIERRTLNFGERHPAIIFVLVLSATVARGTVSPPFESEAAPASCSQVDELVFSKLARLNLQPAQVCPDGAFVRRAYLDVIGTLPTATEARDFILSRDPNKRRALIGRLLERSEERRVGKECRSRW